MYRLVTNQKPPSVIQTAGSLPLTTESWHHVLKPVGELSPRCPPELAKLIEQCMSFNAHARPERMSEVQGRLDQLVEELVTPEDRLDAVE